MQAIEWQFCCEPFQSFKLVCSTVDQLTSCHLTVNCMAPQQQSNSAKSSITATHRCASYFTMGWQIFTKMSLPVGDLDSRLIQCSLGPHKSASGNGIQISAATFAQLICVFNIQSHTYNVHSTQPSNDSNNMMVATGNIERWMSVAAAVAAGWLHCQYSVS